MIRGFPGSRWDPYRAGMIAMVQYPLIGDDLMSGKSLKYLLNITKIFNM